MKIFEVSNEYTSHDIKYQKRTLFNFSDKLAKLDNLYCQMETTRFKKMNDKNLFLLL